MEIVIIIIVLMIMLCVMLIILVKLVDFIVLDKQKSKILLESLASKHKVDMQNLKHQLTNDFLMKYELLVESKDSKIAIPLKKVDVLFIPIESDRILSSYNSLSSSSVTMPVREMKQDSLQGDHALTPEFFRNPQAKEQVKGLIAKKVAEYLVKHDLIESAIDERQQMIKFRMNILS